MKLLRLPDRKSAGTFAEELDRVLGYPKPGKDVGGGSHAPGEQSTTVRHADILQDATTRQWGYPVDMVAEAVLTPVDAADLEALTLEWCAVAKDAMGADDQSFGALAPAEEKRP